eukprot:gene11744-biopygen518
MRSSSRHPARIAQTHCLRMEGCAPRLTAQTRMGCVVDCAAHLLIHYQKGWGELLMCASVVVRPLSVQGLLATVGWPS